MTTSPGTQAPYRQLRRPLDDRIVAGVCSSVGRYFGIDPVLVRVGFAVVAVVTWGVALIAYPVMWFLIPEETAPAAPVWRDPADSGWGRPWTPGAGDPAAHATPSDAPAASAAPTAPAAPAEPAASAAPAEPAAGAPVSGAPRQ
jgi:phage shock protein C